MVCIINSSLQKISCEHKYQWGKGVTLSDTRAAGKLTARDTIKQDGGAARAKNASDPAKPMVIETHVLHDFKHSSVINRVKRLHKVELKQDDRLIGLLTLKDILKCPCEAVLNGSGTNEAILIPVDYFQYEFL